MYHANSVQLWTLYVMSLSDLFKYEKNENGIGRILSKK